MPENLWKMLNPLLTGIGTALAFAAIRRWFPVPPAPAEAGDPLTDAERRSFLRWEVAAIVPILVLIPAMGLGWFFLLKGAANLVHPPLPGTRFLLRPIPILWGLPAVFLGIVSGALPMHWLYRLLLGDRYPRYIQFSNEKAGFDGWRFLRWMTNLTLLGTGVLFFLVTRTFVRFDDQSVEIGRFLALRAATYDYRQVTAIEHRATFVAPNGNTIHRPHYVIRFNDGTTWNARTHAFRDPDPALDAQIANLVSLRSGRPIVEIP